MSNRKTPQTRAERYASKVTATVGPRVTLTKQEIEAIEEASFFSGRHSRSVSPPLTVKRADFERVIEADLHDAGRVGVKARVWLYLPTGGGLTVRHAVESPGYWDILARDAMHAEYFAEECATLETMLTALGVRVTS